METPNRDMKKPAGEKHLGKRWEPLLFRGSPPFAGTEQAVSGGLVSTLFVTSES